MTVEQYSTLVDLMPQIEKALEKKGERIPRPKYGDAEQDDTAVGPEGQQEEEAEEVEVKAKNGKRKKANVEAKSDEDEDD